MLRSSQPSALDTLDTLGTFLNPGGDGLRALGCEPEKIFECNINVLEQLSGFVKGGPTTICLENGGSIDSMLRLVNSVPLIKGGQGVVCGSELGLCLDTGHLNMDGGHVAH